jgi:hypothetical protein
MVIKIVLYRVINLATVFFRVYRVLKIDGYEYDLACMAMLSTCKELVSFGKYPTSLIDVYTLSSLLCLTNA